MKPIPKALNLLAALSSDSSSSLLFEVLESALAKPVLELELESSSSFLPAEAVGDEDGADELDDVVAVSVLLLISVGSMATFTSA